eukprot:2031792-Rhodomonas_salina.1
MCAPKLNLGTQPFRVDPDHHSIKPYNQVLSGKPGHLRLAENGNWDGCLVLVRSAAQSTQPSSTPSASAKSTEGQSCDAEMTELLMEVDPSSGETIMHLAVRAACEAQKEAECYLVFVVFVVEANRNDVDKSVWRQNIENFLLAYAKNKILFGSLNLERQRIGVEFRSSKIHSEDSDSEEATDASEWILLRIEHKHELWDQNKVQQALEEHSKEFPNASTKRRMDVKVLNGVSTWDGEDAMSLPRREAEQFLGCGREYAVENQESFSKLLLVENSEGFCPFSVVSNGRVAARLLKWAKPDVTVQSHMMQDLLQCVHLETAKDSSGRMVARESHSEVSIPGMVSDDGQSTRRNMFYTCKKRMTALGENPLD